MARPPSADHAGLLGDILEVFFVTDAPWCGDRQQGLVDGVAGAVWGFGLSLAFAVPVPVSRAKLQDLRLEQALEDLSVVLALRVLEIGHTAFEHLDRDRVPPPERGQLVGALDYLQFLPDACAIGDRIAMDAGDLAIGWLRKRYRSLGGGTVVRFPRIWMSSGECRFEFARQLGS